MALLNYMLTHKTSAKRYILYVAIVVRLKQIIPGII